MTNGDDSKVERKRAAVRFAIDSARLAGYDIDDRMEPLFEQYMLGEIDSDALMRAALSRSDKTLIK